MTRRVRIRYELDVTLDDWATIPRRGNTITAADVVACIDGDGGILRVIRDWDIDDPRPAYDVEIEDDGRVVETASGGAR